MGDFLARKFKVTWFQNISKISFGAKIQSASDEDLRKNSKFFRNYFGAKIQSNLISKFAESTFPARGRCQSYGFELYDHT